MSFPTGLQTLTPGKASDYSQPTGAPVCVAVQIVNLSAYALAVQAGSNALAIIPSASQILPAPRGGGRVSITPIPTSSTPAGAPCEVELVWLTVEDPVPNPTPITATNLTVNGTVNLSGGTVDVTTAAGTSLTIEPMEAEIGSGQLPATGTTPATFNVTLPPWANTVTVVMAADGVQAAITGTVFILAANVAKTAVAPLIQQFQTNTPVFAGLPSTGGTTPPVNVFPAINNTLALTFGYTQNNDWSKNWGGAHFYVYASSETFDQNVTGQVQVVGAASPYNYGFVSPTSPFVGVDLAVGAFTQPAWDNMSNPNGDTAVSVSPTATGVNLTPAPPAGYLTELTTDVSVNGNMTAGNEGGLNVNGVYIAFQAWEWPATSQYPAAYLFVKGFRTNQPILAKAVAAGLTFCGAYRLIPASGMQISG